MDRQSKTLFVRNLPFTASNQKLIETFEEVGPIKTAFIVTDKESGKCKGYGYVQFSMVEDAVKAKESVTHCDGRKVFINFADAKKNWKRNQKQGADKSQESTEHESGAEPTTKIQEPKKREPKEKTPKQAPVKRCRIVLRNLPFTCKESDIRAHFEKFGSISEVTLPLKQGTLNRGFAFVQYTELKDAHKAVAGMNAQDIMGRPVAVDWAVAKDRFVASSQQQSSQDSKGSEEEQDGKETTESDENNVSESEGSDGEESEKESDEEEDSSDSEDSNEEKEEGENDNTDSDEDEEKEREEQERKREKMKMERKSDVGEGRTLFIRNVPFAVEEEEMGEVFGEFGEVAYVRLVMDRNTGQSRGTAFVQFAQKESAEECLAKAQSSDKDRGLVVQGRQLLVVPALSRSDAQNQKEGSKTKEQKDNRNLFLAREGLIRAGTQAAIGVSEEDMKKRMKVELVKREKLKNLSVFVSSTRICVHNLLPRVDDQELKKTMLQSVGDPTSKITECRVMRDLARTNQAGKAKSLGYAFVNFSTHEHALKALHALNNSTVFGDQRRPIVEFSLENKKALEAKQKRLEKSKVQAAKKQQEGESNSNKRNKPKLQADKTQDRIAKAMHPGAPKGMPKRFGPKIRHKKRQQQQQQQQQQQGKKQKKKQQGLNRPNQQPKPRVMGKKKKKTEVRDNVDRMINKHQGKKSRWFENS
ncbi:hypothetical protein ACOMHN_044067 [Nucella lapillus]